MVERGDNKNGGIGEPREKTGTQKYFLVWYLKFFALHCRTNEELARVLKELDSWR